MSLRRPLPLTRRAAVGGAVAGLALLAGCGTAEPATSPEIDGEIDGEIDPDAALVDELVAELDELVLLVATLREKTRLAQPLAAFEAMHRAHRDALPDAVPAAEPPELGGSPAELYARLLERERRAKDRLADWAVRAESGQLARLVASMAAGVAAHVAAAPARLGGAA